MGHGWFETSHSLFIVRQFVEHGDLRSYMRSAADGDLGNYMRSADVSSITAEIARQVSTGLVILYERELFHGDV